MKCISKWVALSAGVFVLAACSGNLEESLDEVLPSKEAQYKTSRSLPPLEVPPDLSSQGIQDAYLLPGENTQGSATLSGQQVSSNPLQRSIVLPELTDVRVERNGDKRWLVINAPAEAVWPTVRGFWLERGHLIRLEDPSVGIMETDWAENRADIPQGFIRNFLEKISTKLLLGGNPRQVQGPAGTRHRAGNYRALFVPSGSRGSSSRGRVCLAATPIRSRARSRDVEPDAGVFRYQS